MTKPMANDQSPDGSRILDSILCAVATAAYFAAVLPLQSYLANADGFAFGLGDVAFGCCLRMICLAVPLGIVLAATNRWCKWRLHLFLIGLTLAAMAESGPGAIGLPELNGEFAGYRDAVRGAIDLAALAIVLVAPVLLRKWLKGCIGVISICITLFAASSLFDVKRAQPDCDASNEYCVKEFVPRVEVLQCAKFSPVDNVILLILDATASYAVQDILRADAQLASRFEGFVNYVCNVGMHNPTQVGLPGLLTGKYFQSSRDIAWYGRSYYSKDSVIAPYVGKNIPVYFNVDLGVNGYTNRRMGKNEPAKPTGLDVFREQMPGIFALTLDDICAFRIVPYLFKERFIMTRKGGGGASGDVPSGRGANEGDRPKSLSKDSHVWSFLARRRVDDDCRQTFHVHHTRGGHWPIVYDENGNDIKCPNPKYEDYCGQCKFALRSVAEMFDAWKTNGVYDASTIIVAADHGTWLKLNKSGAVPSKIPTTAFPVLMVKPRASREKYRESDLPTTHANVSKAIKAMASRTLNRAEIEQVLSTDEPRLFRLADSGKLKDWYVSRDGKVEFVERVDEEPALESLRPLEYDVNYEFRASDSAAYPDFRVERGNRINTGGVSIAGREMTVYVKVPESCEIALNGATTTRNKNEAFVDLEVDGRHWAFKAEYSRNNLETVCKIDSVKPDGNGIVKMVFRPVGGVSFVLRKIKLSRSGE